MKYEMIKMTEIGNYRETLESSIVPSGICIMYFILVTLLSLGIWSYFSEIDVVVKARGEIKPSTHIHTIKNMANGAISNINFTKGDTILEGQIIYVIDSESKKIELKSYQDKLNTINYEAQMLQILKKCIEKNQNIFIDLAYDGNDEVEKDLFDKYRIETQNFIFENERLNRESDFLLRNIELLIEERVNNNEILKLLSGENSNKNVLKDEYLLKYNSYLGDLGKLERECKKTEKTFQDNKVLFENGSVSQVEYNNSQRDFELSKIDKLNYAMNFESELRSRNNQLKIELLSNQSKLAEIAYMNNNEVVYTSNYIVKSMEVASRIEINRTKREELLSSIAIVKDAINLSSIRSPFHGVVDFDYDLSVGDYLESGQQIGRVLPMTENNYRVQLLVSNKDISNINVGDAVKYRIDAFTYKEYGVIEGVVSKISESSVSQHLNSSGYYIVECTMPDEKMHSYKGEVGNIKIGMQLEGHIITRRKKVLLILFEKMNFL